MAKIPEKLQAIIKEVGLTERQATWDCHGTPVVLHKALEKIAAAKNIVFDAPQIIECSTEKKYAVLCVTGHMEGVTEWSIGEAAPYNNKNSYPFAMAEKRAKDRVILKLVGLHGDVYSEEEADDFKAAKPEEVQANPTMDMTTDDRADAWLEFFNSKPDAQKFADNESRFQKFMAKAEDYLSAEKTANLWDKHNERKVELMV